MSFEERIMSDTTPKDSPLSVEHAKVVDLMARLTERLDELRRHL